MSRQGHKNGFVLVSLYLADFPSEHGCQGLMSRRNRVRLCVCANQWDDRPLGNLTVKQRDATRPENDEQDDRHNDAKPSVRVDRVLKRLRIHAAAANVRVRSAQALSATDPKVIGTNPRIRGLNRRVQNTQV